MRLLRYAALSAALATTPGCAKKPPEPQLASSATSPGYATGYPEALAAVRTTFFDEEKVVNTAAGELSGYPDQLDEPDWTVVAAVIRHADEEGRSQAYAERFERLQTVRAFYDTERDEIRRKVAGSVQYQAKKKKCEGDVGSSAGPALDKAVKERLEERLHEGSDAHTVIDAHREALGKKNAETLEHQADAIGMASYVAHVGVVREKVKLRRMLEELEQVSQTLDRTLDDLQKMQGDEELDDDTRKRLEERHTAAKQAKARIDAEAQGAENLSKEIESRIEKLQKTYDDAVAALETKIDQHAGASGTSKP
jgi:hypothetical protein